MVLNQIEQGGRQEAVLAGSLSFPDGNLIITHPNTGLNILGTVEAGSVTIATQNLDAQASIQVMSGESADFMNAAPSSRLNILGGRVSATSGDVVLGGPAVLVGGSDSEGSEGSQILAPQGQLESLEDKASGCCRRMSPQALPASKSFREASTAMFSTPRKSVRGRW